MALPDQGHRRHSFCSGRLLLSPILRLILTHCLNPLEIAIV